MGKRMKWRQLPTGTAHFFLTAARTFSLCGNAPQENVRDFWRVRYRCKRCIEAIEKLNKGRRPDRQIDAPST